MSVLFVALHPLMGHADSVGHPPQGGEPDFDPACKIVSISGPHVDYWVSWNGPTVAPGLPFNLENFLNCPLGRKILHPRWCLDITMLCYGADPKTETMCFHAGGGVNGGVDIFPSHYIKPGAEHGTLNTPNLPSDISPDAFREFWDWYRQRRDDSFDGVPFCLSPSEDGISINCGSYFLLTLSKLLGITMEELRKRMPQLSKCTHISYDLYTPEQLRDLEPLLMLQGWEGGIFQTGGADFATSCPMLAGLGTEENSPEIPQVTK